MSPSQFARGFNGIGACGKARDYMCEGSLAAVAQRCATDTALDASERAINDCSLSEASEVVLSSLT